MGKRAEERRNSSNESSGWGRGGRRANVDSYHFVTFPTKRVSPPSNPFSEAGRGHMVGASQVALMQVVAALEEQVRQLETRVAALAQQKKQ